VHGERPPERLHHLPHGLDPALQPLDQLRLVAPGDQQLLVAEDRPADLDLAPVALGVDHVDARWRDREVVDVRAAARHGPVVQDRNVGTALEQGLRKGLLAGGARLPCLHVCRSVLKPQQQPADSRMPLTYAAFTVRPPPLVLAPTACPSGRVDLRNSPFSV
jgi:hypothetical protein